MNPKFFFLILIHCSVFLFIATNAGRPGTYIPRVSRSSSKQRCFDTGLSNLINLTLLIEEMEILILTVQFITVAVDVM
jgi:hypothetical protein